MLVWVTGSAGVGKSTACEALLHRGFRAVDADWEGYNHSIGRSTDRRVEDPPYAVPPGWLTRYSWCIDIDMVEHLAAESQGHDGVLFGSVENEIDVWHLFDLVICLVADDDALTARLATRTTNAFGKHPDELAAVLERNQTTESTYRSLGATILDTQRPVEDVADTIIGVLASSPPESPRRRGNS